MYRCVFAVVLTTFGSIAAADVDISFQSPSGNIRCDMSRDASLAVRCDLGVDQQSYTRRPATCQGRRVLPYGRRAILDGITCLSERTGVTRTNIEGGGFEVRRAEQRVF